MPGRGGAWLVREIQKRWPEISIIVITAAYDSDSLAQCLDAGAHHYFVKPINFDEFHHALQSTLRRHGLHRDRERLKRRVARQTRKIRQTFLSAIASLVRTLEARDPNTSGHSLRVRTLASRLARKLGMGAETRRELVLAAKLHDIGKVSLPEGILNKPSTLTEEEYATVRLHPEIGERILAPIIHSLPVLAAIRNHHERYDGNGYPDRLAGEAIPLLARIISVADCFDALTSNRAYRPAMSEAEALAIVESNSGTQFDPTLVTSFVEMIQSESALQENSTASVVHPR